jgi:transposase
MENVAVVSMDVHKKFSRVSELDQAGEVLRKGRLEHRDRVGMEEYFRGFARGTDVVMEATFNWPWIADLVEGQDLRVHLGHPPRVRELAKGKAKTDLKDAIFLGRLWLQRVGFPESYLAPREVRGLRSRFRYRLMLVRMQTRIKNHIHGMLNREGVLIEDCTDLFGGKGRRILAGLSLAGELREELLDKLKLLDEIFIHIGVVEGWIRGDLRRDPRAELLMTIPGVGEITAYSLLAEIGEVERFPSSRALAAYAGVLPLARESAERKYPVHTSSFSNRYLRWALTEAVTGAVVSSSRMASLHGRVLARNRKSGGKARVAVAREIVEVAYVVLKKGVRYQENRPPRPGQSRGRARRLKAKEGVAAKSRTRIADGLPTQASPNCL